MKETIHLEAWLSHWTARYQQQGTQILFNKKNDQSSFFLKW